MMKNLKIGHIIAWHKKSFKNREYNTSLCILMAINFINKGQCEDLENHHGFHWIVWPSLPPTNFRQVSSLVKLIRVRDWHTPPLSISCTIKYNWQNLWTYKWNIIWKCYTYQADCRTYQKGGGNNISGNIHQYFAEFIENMENLMTWKVGGWKIKKWDEVDGWKIKIWDGKKKNE